MNIISNSCLNAIIHRDYIKQQYTNPFCWCYIDTKSFYNLIKNYDTLNWFNYELNKDKNWNFSITIDTQVKIDYPHYKFNKKYNKLEKQGNNILSNHIWTYIIDSYEKRVKRMLELNEKPIFIIGNIHENIFRKYDKDYIRKIDELDTVYDVALFSNLHKFYNKPSFQYNEKFINNFDLTKFIWDSYLCQKF